jgi:hypothetical protein
MREYHQMRFWFSGALALPSPRFPDIDKEEQLARAAGEKRLRGARTRL